MKANLSWILTALIFLGIISTLIFWPKAKLLFPQADYTPQLSYKLQSKIAAPQALDFSTAKKLTVKASFYLVFNLDSGQVYLASGAAEKISPASFTKLLTGQVALDLGFSDQLLTATRTSVDKVPTILGLKVGEQFQLSDLLRAAIATSANDAAATLAEGIASQNGLALSDFIDLMNKKGELLKMENSHFSNPDGLDDTTQFSTLIDIVRLVQNTVKNYPEIMAAAVSDRQDIQESSTHGFYYVSNWNGLLGVYPGVFGGKIAFTENAGNSTIVLSERNKVRLAVIVSGAPTLLDRDQAAASLLDRAFLSEKIPPANVTEWQLKQHYRVWNDLINKTRAALAGGRQ
ncbi:MAG: hypothetical protein AAB973_03840 [Patescibacteria group bacterium]